MIVNWSDLAELVKEHGIEKGTLLFVEMILTSDSLKNQVDELDVKNG